MDLPHENLLLERYAKGMENSLIERYILDGPTDLRENLGLTEGDWQIIFDYLVFEHNLLYKTVTQSMEFFVDAYVQHGMAHMRDILDITHSRYDKALEVIFDFIAISNGGVYYHVLQNRDRYMVAFRARGGDFVRKVLGLWKEKYEEQWLKILDILLHACCDAIFSEQTFDHGLRGFSCLMNSMRVHRPICKSEMFSQDLAL